MEQKEYLKLALGFICTTMTTPLLGLVDTAMMGHLDDPAYIGGVAIGALIFSTIYWLFGFLRISTIAFTAQAKSTEQANDLMWAVCRPLVIAWIISFGFLIFQQPLLNVILSVIKPSSMVELYAREYFNILVWGAPCVLTSYVCTGWLMGNTRLKANFFLQIFTNLLNLILVYLFVIKFQWAVFGVASATLIAQIFSCLSALLLIGYYGAFKWQRFTYTELLDKRAFKKIMVVNSDLMIRTVCLLIMTNLFMAKSSTFGVSVLAANAILFQLHYFIGTFIDGFSSASSIVSGRAVGKKDMQLFRQGVRLSYYGASIMIMILTGFYFITADIILSLFTHIESVLVQAYYYSYWLALYPLAYGFNSVLYGIFNGATLSGPVRNSTIVALTVFLLCLWSFVPIFGNHGLWASFIIFNCVRSLYLFICISFVSKQINSLFLKSSTI